jgi:NADH-quinone oxidoreductase subunit J
MLPEVFFWYLAAAITVLALLVITRRNPVHSVLYMLVLFFHVAALYLFLDAEFMAAIQVIVYAGAILVLFLFVVLLLNLKEEMMDRRYIGLWPLGLLLAAGISAVMFKALGSLALGPQGMYSVQYIERESNVAALGKLLYTEFLFPFEVASVVLLVAIVGAIVLAKKRMNS